MRVGWVVPDLKATTASTRYRCFYPALALAEHGVESRFFTRSDDLRATLDEVDAIVFVKRIDGKGPRLADAARVAGKPVYIDMCDNVVASAYPKELSFAPTATLAAVSSLAEAVVTSSPALIDVLRPLLPASTRILEIPDQIETPETFAAATALADRVSATAAPPPAPSMPGRVTRLLQYFRRDPGAATRVVARKLAAPLGALRPSDSGVPTASREEEPSVPCRAGGDEDEADPILVPSMPRPKTVLWFGIWGAPHSDYGMLALLQAADALERVARDVPLELLVVSNSRPHFDTYIAALDVPTRFVPWSSAVVFEALDRADVCLLPFGHDAFSLTKSANRIALALHRGVPVVTSRIASLEPLHDAVAFDDWEAGLRRYLGPGGEGARARSIEAARPILERLYAPSAIGRQWRDLLSGPRRNGRRGLPAGAERMEVGVLLDSPEDLDLLLPVVDALRRREGTAVRLLLSPGLVRQAPQALRAVVERGLVPFALERDAVLTGEDRILRSLDALLTAGEAAAAEGLSAALVRSANALGVATYALLSEAAAEADAVAHVLSPAEPPERVADIVVDGARAAETAPLPTVR